MFMSFNARAAGLDLSAVETIELAAREGFGGVDLLVRDLVDAGSELRPLRARLDDLGLRGGAFPLPMSWRASEGEFTRDLARLPRYAAAAAALGLARTGTWVMPETPASFPGGEGQAATVALHLARLGAIARVLGAHGIRLGLEVIGVSSAITGGGEPFVCRLADLWRVLDPLGQEAPGVGVLVDTYHLYAAHEPIEAALTWGAGRVVWVHVADLPASARADRAAMRDQDRGLPGEHGAVPSRRWLQRLSDEGYDGPVTAEPMAGCRSLQGLPAGDAVRKIAAALRTVWPE